MSDNPIDSGDLLANRQANAEAQGLAQQLAEIGRQSLEAAQKEYAARPDPANRNLAMQLAIQKYPQAPLSELKIHADEFYSYLTQQN